MLVSKSGISNGNNNGNLTDDESFRANQYMLTRGYRATKLYMQLAQATNNEVALRVLNEVVDENRVHIGESLKLLYELADEEEKVLTHRTEKVEEILNETI